MQDERGNSALIEACQGGHVETARILLDHGANLHYQNGVLTFDLLMLVIDLAAMLYSLANQLSCMHALLVRPDV